MRFVVPYSLVTYPDHKFIKKSIEATGQRIKEFKATGIVVKPWPNWNKDPQNGRDSDGGASEKLVNI